MFEAAQRTPASRDTTIAGTDLPFAVAELRAHLENTAAVIKQKPQPPFQEIASSLEALASNAEEHAKNLEDLERHLTALEEKLVAAVRILQTDTELYTLREALDRELKPYRGKMTADQLSMLERRYLDTALLERSQLPRLSLFYLH